ncbi:MAG: Jag N-terminal domain-containing protein [Oscillospiraceae bacterium]|nr:Jag N-terminal domain-containing protein [Oscillospiraceae bacterium]
MKSTVTAKTVEEAKLKLCAELGVPAEKITFTVLEEPKKGLFGMKGEAKVEGEYNLTKAEIAANYVSDIMVAMGYTKPTITITETEEGAVLDLSGEGVDGIIGRRGETIDSLQYLASLACNKQDKEFYRITLDCDGFRARRKVQLEELARKMAEKAKRTGRTMSLEPMNPYERRIIHAAVSEVEGCTSRSVGEDPYRKVLISSTERRPYNGGNRRYNNGGRNDRRDGNRNGGYRKNGGRRREDFKARSLDISSSFEKDYKKPKPEDDLGSALYSKIEF